MEKRSRRAFLGMAALGAAGSAAAVAGHAMGVDKGIGEDNTAYRFQCTCGNSRMAEVPKEVGDVVRFECECGQTWGMTWQGDHFSVRQV